LPKFRENSFTKLVPKRAINFRSANILTRTANFFKRQMSLLGTESEEKEQTTISSQSKSLKNNSKDLTGEIDNFKLLIISAGSKNSNEKSAL